MINLVVSFSGGLTSGYMCYMLKKYYSTKYQFHFIFANTGLECEETLEFVDKCDSSFGLNLVWVEAVVNPKHGVGITHKVVDFKTASRNGEPFEDFIRKSGIPNRNKPQCSDRLKAFPIEHWKKEHGLRMVKHAIGIRSDEPKRRSTYSVRKYNIVYPLLDWRPSDKQDVNTFWEGMPFTLGLEEHEGNCQTCWKKSDKKLYLLALEHPERFSFMDRMEESYDHIKPNESGVRRVFFRGNRSSKQIIESSKEFDSNSLRRLIYSTNDDHPSGCSESCEAYSDE